MDLEKILPKDGPPINEVTKYIKKYKNDLIVIKYGGNVLIDRNVFNNFITDLSVLNKLGLATVVIHGGGPRIKRELEKSNIQSKFIRGLRVTELPFPARPFSRKIFPGGISGSMYSIISLSLITNWFQSNRRKLS